MKLKLNPHISEGHLRAYLDAELDTAEVDILYRHLDTCPDCQNKLAELSHRASQVSLRFSKLASPLDLADPIAARAQLDRYKSTKETQPMINKFISRNTRLVWATVTLIILIAATFAFPQVRAIATDFLGLFRVEKVTVVTFNPSNIPDEFSSAGPRIEQLLADDVTIESFGETHEVSDRTQAAAEAGIPIRLPLVMGDPSVLTVQPQAKFTFTIDLPRLRLILQEMGKGDIELPDFIQGQTVTADLPVSVTALFGDCQTDIEMSSTNGYDPDDTYSDYSNCTVLIQLASPSVSAPPGLDINRIGAVFLELSGMSSEEAELFSQTVDWATTLVIPVPNYASSSEVTVDGVQGVLVQRPASRERQTRFTLIWVKDSIVYSLNGHGSTEDALSIANSLK
jgi:anti-sigma factor RsiW